MRHQNDLQSLENTSDCSRRQFLAGALGAAAMPVLGGAGVFAADSQAQETTPIPPKRKLKLGLVGCGGRGTWISQLFLKHGGYEFHAVADYFQANADRCGETLGVAKSRRFSGLSGYQKVLQSGIEAVALIVPPCFLPEHSSAAAEAGIHVYMAKPVAVDVPGCLRVLAAGKLARQKRQAFLVDYQMPTDPVNIQVAERIRQREFGELMKLLSVGITGGRSDPPKTATIESRLQNLVWDNDIAIGGSFINSYDIHAIDAAVWAVGQRPVSAMGYSRIGRVDPHGDGPDVTAVVYEYADGLIHEHSGVALPTSLRSELGCTFYGQHGYAVLNYWGKSRFHVRSEEPLAAEVESLYDMGATRNIARFYQDVMEERFDNPTVERAVDGCLTCLLGRDATLRRERLTMEEFLKENKRIELDLTGLKV